MFATIIAIASLLLSIFTLWLTQFWRGRLGLTQPTLVFLGKEGDPPHPKIFLRTLLFCSADKGCVVENMFLKVHNETGIHLFDFWGYGERDLVKGSGLFVPRTGVSFNHHFLLNRNAQNFAFAGGEYEIEIFAKVVGQKSSKALKSIKLNLTGDQAPAMIQVDRAGLFFEWNAETERYASHLDVPPEPRIRFI